MDIISKFTSENWIAIAAIVVPIIIGWLGKIHIWLWSLAKKYLIDRKIEVVSSSFDHRFASLNKQIQACSFLNSDGTLSIKSLQDNHRALLQGTPGRPGEFRENEVFIKCYTINDNAGGTTLVSEKESTTNLLPAKEVNLGLSDIIDDWNTKVARVKAYGTKDKIEFVSRFHICFEMIHPFLDGNGRIGRKLLEEQLSYLFDRIISFDPDIRSYHRCIELGTKGDESELRKLIFQQVNVNS